MDKCPVCSSANAFASLPWTSVQFPRKRVNTFLKLFSPNLRISQPKACEYDRHPFVPLSSSAKTGLITVLRTSGTVSRRGRGGQKRTGLMNMKMNMNTPTIRTQAICAPKPAHSDVFITKDELARRLKKTTRTIENWQRQGFLPFIKLCRSTFHSKRTRPGRFRPLTTGYGNLR